ncbi:MAG: hypothetical protein J6Z80_06000, partial [Clostridia bacterium]|nr:hypothetical protein [Clostridia bacterium]
MNKVRSFFGRLFSGCYGIDDIGRLNLWMIALFCLLQCVGYVAGSMFLVWFSRAVYIILAAVFFFRLLSKNAVRRRSENNKYLKLVRKIKDGAVLLKNRPSWLQIAGIVTTRVGMVTCIAAAGMTSSLSVPGYI